MDKEISSGQFSIKHLITIISLVSMVLAGWNWILNGQPIHPEWFPIIEIPYPLVGPGIKLLPVFGVVVLLTTAFALVRYQPVPVSIVLFLGILPAIFFLGPPGIASFLICIFASSVIILIESLVRRLPFGCYLVPALCLLFSLATYLWIGCLVSAI